MDEGRSEHPTAEEMTAFCNGAASGPELDAIDRHISNCVECSREMARTVKELAGMQHVSLTVQ